MFQLKKKTILTSILIAALSVFIVACGGGNSPASTDSITLTVGATDVPHAEVLEFIKPILAEQGIELNIRVFNDYTMPNQALAGGDLDANYFQHKPWLENYVLESGNHLISLIGVHIEPMGGYSKKVTTIEALTDGATVGIPNAISEVGRVLALLESHNLLTLRAGVGLEGTLQDIIENPKNLTFIEVDASLLAPTIDEYDLAIINTNFALQAGFVPAVDALIMEGTESPYVNVVAIRADSINNKAINALADVLLSSEVAQFLNDHYAGAVVPAQVRY